MHYENTKTNYIIACYIGPNRRYDHYKHQLNRDPLFFITKHVEFLRTVPNRHSITGTIVVNDDIDTATAERLRELSPEFTVILRKNSGFSYGIWNDVVNKTLYQYDNFFLIEDDYLPCTVDFLDPFIQRTYSTDTAFVCGMVETASHARFPEHVEPHTAPFLFPSISNGLLVGDKARKAFEIYGSVFRVNQHNEYWTAYTNQIFFCKNLTDLGFNIIDTLDEFSSPYNTVYNGITLFGGAVKPPLLKPIEVPYV